MSKWGWGKRASIVGALVVSAVVAVAGRVDRPDQAALPDPGRLVPQPIGAMTADVTLRHGRVKKDGTPTGVELPPVTMRFSRRLEGGRWRSTLVFHHAPRPTARLASARIPLDNPFVVARVDFDEDKGEATAFDARGRQLPLPAEADRRRFFPAAVPRVGSLASESITAGTARDLTGRIQALQTTGFVADIGSRERRRTDLERAFGRPVGRLRGLDRFLTSEGVITRELLADPGAAVPMEMNTTSSGVLRARTELRYVTHGTLGHVREFMRSEQVLEGTDDERVVTDMQLSDVVMAWGGGQ